jgi:hypothetical protein
MNYHNELEPFDSSAEPSDAALCPELRIYRPDGALSVIYLTAFENDTEAMAEAERIARNGYRIDVWRDGRRIAQVGPLRPVMGENR